MNLDWSLIPKRIFFFPRIMLERFFLWIRVAHTTIYFLWSMWILTFIFTLNFFIWISNKDNAFMFSKWITCLYNKWRYYKQPCHVKLGFFWKKGIANGLAILNIRVYKTSEVFVLQSLNLETNFRIGLSSCFDHLD